MCRISNTPSKQLAICIISREPFIKVAKLSSISIGQLRPLLALHPRPINLVVYQGTSELAFNET